LKTLKWDVKLTAEIETDSVNGGPDKANYTGNNSNHSFCEPQHQHFL